MGTSVATYYDILRVSREAAPERVRTAYRSLAQRYHPDKLPGSDDAVRVMAMLNEAYAVLSDPEKRARYDRSIEGGARRVRRHPRLREAAWPWWLLFATVAFAVTAIVTVAYRMVFPTVAVAAPAAVAQQVAATTSPPKSRLK